MDLQYDGSLTDLLMNDTDLYDDTIQSNPTVLAPVQNEVVPRLRKSQRTKNFSVDHPHWNERMKMERQKVERHDKICAQQEIALEQHRKQLEIEERQVQEIQMKNEMKIMETDTTGIDPLSATYWNNLKIEVMKKRGFNF